MVTEMKLWGELREGVAELWEMIKKWTLKFKIWPLLASRIFRVQSVKKRDLFLQKLLQAFGCFWWGAIGSVILLILEKVWTSQVWDGSMIFNHRSGFSVRVAEHRWNMPRWSWKMTWQNSSPNGKNWWPWNDAQYCTRSVGIGMSITTTTWLHNKSYSGIQKNINWVIPKWYFIRLGLLVVPATWLLRLDSPVVLFTCILCTHVWLWYIMIMSAYHVVCIEMCFYHFELLCPHALCLHLQVQILKRTSQKPQSSVEFGNHENLLTWNKVFLCNYSFLLFCLVLLCDVAMFAVWRHQVDNWDLGYFQPGQWRSTLRTCKNLFPSFSTECS